jgi:hypothetical protein
LRERYAKYWLDRLTADAQSSEIDNDSNNGIEAGGEDIQTTLPNTVPFLPFNLALWTESLYVSTLFLSYKDAASAFYNERFQFREGCYRFRSILLIPTERGQIAVFSGLLPNGEKKKNWRDGVELLNIPSNPTPSTLQVKGKEIRVPSISAYRFVSSLAAPSEKSTMVKNFEKRVDGSLVRLPATWLVGDGMFPGEGIECKVLLDDHVSHAPHLATCNFPAFISPADVDAVLRKYKALSPALRFLHRGNSIRMYSPDAFSTEVAETLRGVDVKVSIHFDAGIAPSINAIITSTPDIPLTSEFVTDLSEGFGFKVPHAFTTASVFVVFRSALHFSEAAEALGAIGLSVDRHERSDAAAKDREEG